MYNEKILGLSVAIVLSVGAGLGGFWYSLENAQAQTYTKISSLPKVVDENAPVLKAVVKKTDPDNIFIEYDGGTKKYLHFHAVIAWRENCGMDLNSPIISYKQALMRRAILNVRVENYSGSYQTEAENQAIAWYKKTSVGAAYCEHIEVMPGTYFITEPPKK